jgi:hypothetical protein
VEFDEDEFDLQLQSICSSQLYCSLAIGFVGGALVGSAGRYLTVGMKSSLLKVAIMIACIMWFVLYIVPTVKYQSNPEGIICFLSDGICHSLLAVWCAIWSGCAWYCLWISVEQEKSKGCLELLHYLPPNS